MFKAKQWDEATTYFTNTYTPTQLTYLKVSGDFVNYQTELAEQVGKDAESLAASSRMLVISLAVTAVLIGVFLAFLITRSITRPVNEALNAATRLAEGDLTVKIESDSKDEVGMLMSAMQNMIGKLTQIIGESENGGGQPDQCGRTSLGHRPIAVAIVERTSRLG